METKIEKFASLRDSYRRAEAGEVAAQKCIIGCLNNLGCDHLARPQKGYPKWRRHYLGLMEYLGALVSEYGERESTAERELLAELNAARTCCDDIEVED